MRIMLAALCFLCVPVRGLCPPGTEERKIDPEQLLPGDSVFYFRYDGYDSHRKAYDQTALAKVMKEGLADFLEHVIAKVATSSEDLLGAKADRPALDDFFSHVSRHGFLFSVEVPSPAQMPTNAGLPFHLTIVLPHGAEPKNRRAIDGFLRNLARNVELEIEESKHAGRTVQIVSQGELKLAWWNEGPHLVWAFGTQPLQKWLRIVKGQQPSVATAKWHIDLLKSASYETDMRGYVDVKRLVDWLAVVGLEKPGIANMKDHLARQVVLRHLGLGGLKDLTFHLGFDGKYQRSTIRLGVVKREARTGLLNLFAGEVDTFATDKLPPLPPDTDYVSVQHVDWALLYDYVVRTSGLLALRRLLGTGDLAAGSNVLADLDFLLGIDLRKDLLEQLDTTLISYGGHSEGPFFLGQGFAVRVKNEALVRKSLAVITKALTDAGDPWIPRQRKFREHEMYVFSDLYLPVTFTLHKGWLVAGLAPQSVQGFLLRSDGKYRAWKSPPELEEVLAKESKANPSRRPRALTMSDPRPAVTIGLSLLPTFVQTVKQAVRTEIMDVDRIPNSQTINEWLFPNVIVSYDDGDALRWEHHFSMAAPDDFLIVPLASLMWATPLWAYADVFDSVEPKQPRNVPPAPPVVPPPEPVPPPKKMPEKGEEPKQPTKGSATASEKDGVVHLRLTESVPISYTTTRKVSEVVTIEVMENGVPRTRNKTVVKNVVETHQRLVARNVTLIADGKDVQVTTMNGNVIDPKELPKRLAKETPVVVVRGRNDAAILPEVDERTVIIRIGAAAQLK